MAGRMNVSFDKSGVGENWPLINFLWAQPDYRAKYNAYVKDAIETVFEPTKVVARIDATAKILAPFAAKTSSDAAYTTSVETLKSTVQARVQAAKEYLATL